MAPSPFHAPAFDVKRGPRPPVDDRVAARARELAEELGLAPAAAGQVATLVAALAAEPDPPTTVRDPSQSLELHVADSLAGIRLAPIREAARIADVGAGAGFPGLPLAIALPGASLDLIEASRRKCEVIGRLAVACDATNARVVCERAEAWGAGEGAEAYDVVTARAVAPLAVLAEYAAPLLRVGGALVAWKGRRDEDEEAGAAAACAVLGMAPVEVRRVEPFPAARERHLHVLRKRAPTPARFPRRPGRAAKRPLR